MSEGVAFSPLDPMRIIACIRQFGLAADGCDLRDLAVCFAIRYEEAYKAALEAAAKECEIRARLVEDGKPLRYAAKSIRCLPLPPIGTVDDSTLADPLARTPSPPTRSDPA